MLQLLRQSAFTGPLKGLLSFLRRCFSVVCVALKTCLPLLVALACVLPVSGQDHDINCSDSTYCMPSVPGMPRSKGIIIDYEHLFGYQMRSLPVLQGLDASTDRIQKEKRFEAKLRIPIYMSDAFRFGIGFSYYNEEYYFSDSTLENPLHRQLNDQNLRSYGTTLYFSKSWLGRHYFLMRVSGNLNGDFTQGTTFSADRYLKLSVAPMFGYKRDDYTSMGAGVSWSYNFGRPTIIPFIVYHHTFNDRWGFESIIPAFVRIRYNHNESMLGYAGVEVDGGSYTIHPDDDLLTPFNAMQLRRSDLRAYLTVEREIHDWLWVKFETGARFNLSFDLTTEEILNSRDLINTKRAPAGFLRAGIFIVPPRKFFE